MYRSLSLSNLKHPSMQISNISLADLGDLRPMLSELLINLSQCKSKSGYFPSILLAPSKTSDPSQVDCVIGPRIGGLPSIQSSSIQVTASIVFLHFLEYIILTLAIIR